MRRKIVMFVFHKIGFDGFYNPLYPCPLQTQINGVEFTQFRFYSNVYAGKALVEDRPGIQQVISHIKALILLREN